MPSLSSDTGLAVIVSSGSGLPAKLSHKVWLRKYTPLHSPRLTSNLHRWTYIVNMTDRQDKNDLCLISTKTDMVITLTDFMKTLKHCNWQKNCLRTKYQDKLWRYIISNFHIFKGVLHLWALFLKTLCIFSKSKAISDKVSRGSGQKCSKELKNHSFT